MTLIDFFTSGPGSNLSWTGGNVYSHAPIPNARLAHSGYRPIIVDSLAFYISGRYGSESVRVWISNNDGGAGMGSGASSTGLFSIPQQYGVTSLRGGSVKKLVTNANGGGYLKVGVNPASSGALVVYGRNAVGGMNVYRDGSVNWGGYALAGRYNYVQVPTAPTSQGLVQVGPGTAKVSWSAPADSGGTSVTGYLVQRTQALPWGAAPITNVTLGAGARSHTFTGLATGTWHTRVFASNAVTAAANTFSQASFTHSVVLTAGNPGDLDEWERFGTLPAGIQENTTAGLRRATVSDLLVASGGPAYPAVSAILKENYVTVAAARTLEADTHGGQRTVDGLTPGRTYRLYANGAWRGTVGDSAGGGQTPNIYQIGVQGIGWAAPVEFFQQRVVKSLGMYEFIATATSHEIAFRLDESTTRTGPIEMESFAIFEVDLIEMPTSVSPFRLQSVAYESTLLNHFDLACNSVGGRWYVDRSGVTQFLAQLPAAPLVATFTDSRTEGNLEYVDIGMAYDTRAIVNDIELSNHGAKLEDNGWTTDDETRNYKNLTSIATWGPRGASVDMSLYDQGAFAGSVDARAADLIDDALTLGSEPVWIRWNAQEAPETVALLEIYSRVDIVFRGKTYQCRVINLKHDLTPKRWMITIQLIRK